LTTSEIEHLTTSQIDRLNIWQHHKLIN